VVQDSAKSPYMRAIRKCSNL